MAIVVSRVDDLHKAEEGVDVPAAETVSFMLDETDYAADLTAEHAAELRAFLGRYVSAIVKVAPQATGRRASGSSATKRKAPQQPSTGAASSLQQARMYRKRMRAFADSRADLGEKSYMTPGGNMQYTERLEKAYAEYLAEHDGAEFPLPEDKP
jgi:Lsr2